MTKPTELRIASVRFRHDADVAKPDVSEGTLAKAPQPGHPGATEYVPSMYQHNGKQRYTEGNSGQHEVRSGQVKSVLPGMQQSFAHNPKVAGSNPAPATDGNARKH